MKLIHLLEDPSSLFSDPSVFGIDELSTLGNADDDLIVNSIILCYFENSLIKIFPTLTVESFREIDIDEDEGLLVNFTSTNTKLVAQDLMLGISIDVTNEFRKPTINRSYALGHLCIKNVPTIGNKLNSIVMAKLWPEFLNITANNHNDYNHLVAKQLPNGFELNPKYVELLTKELS